MVDLQRHLHAALLAWSLNIGPTRMAEGDCTSVRRHVTAPSRRRALRSTDRLHEQGEPSGAAPIGVDTSASAGLRHKRGRPAHGPRPAFVLRRNSTTARQETRFARFPRPARFVPSRRNSCGRVSCPFPQRREAGVRPRDARRTRRAGLFRPVTRFPARADRALRLTPPPATTPGPPALLGARQLNRSAGSIPAEGPVGAARRCRRGNNPLTTIERALPTGLRLAHRDSCGG